MCVVVEERGQSKLPLAEAVEYARLHTARLGQAVAIAMAMRGLMRFYFNVRVGPHVILDIEGTDLSSPRRRRPD
jgi:hypothetical protein